MRIGSLFSGAGGLDMAVAEVFGGTVAWHCEVDAAASKVLAYRYPGVPNLSDITAVDWTQVEPVDVLCGGFPCQDVSSAGKRAGLKDGTRSGLWSMFADAIDVLRPRFVVAENVRGLLNAAAHRPMEPDPDALGDGESQPVLRAAGAVLGDLSDLGYDAQWCTVPASSVGAPHRRERVFILAGSTDADDLRPQANQFAFGRQPALPGPGASELPLLVVADATQPERGGSQQQHLGATGGPAAEPRERFSKSAARGSNAADSSGDGWDEGRPEPARLERGFDAAVSGDGPGVALLPTPQARDWKDANSGSPAEIDRHTPNLGAVSHYLPTPSASDGTGGGQHPDRREGHSRQLCDYALMDGTTRWGKYGPAIERWENATRPAPAPTEPNSKGNPRLNAAFSEWMMGWPAGWVTDVPGIKRNDALRIVGNGVCPQQAIAALRYLLSVR